MIYSIPKIKSFNKIFDNIDKLYSIVRNVTVTPKQSFLKGTDLNNHILELARDTYENKVGYDGFIKKIYEVTNIGDGIFQDYFYKYRITLLCNIFYPKIGDVLVGCYLHRIINKVQLNLTYYTCNINVFIDDDGDTDDMKFELHKKYNIQIKSIQFSLNKPSILLRIFNDKFSKIYYIKKIIENDDLKIKFITNRNETYVYDKKIYQVKLFTPKHMHIIGKIFNLYTIPPGLGKSLLFPIQKDRQLSYNIKNLKPVDITKYNNKMLTDINKIIYSKYKHLWDSKYKMLVNPYELLLPNFKYSSDFKMIGKISPVSRAYFKAVDIIKEFNIQSGDGILATIADAPGGWAQSFNILFPKKKIITTSLKSGIKYNTSIINNKKIVIDYLINKDGDLLNIKNIKHMINKYRNKCSIIGCDGALIYDDKYMDNPIPKEYQHHRLFYMELIICLGLQKLGGSCFIKLYKCKTSVTKQLFALMNKYYKNISIYKPKSIRIGNTELMLVCNNFIGIDHDKLQQLLNYADTINQIFSSGEYISNIFDTDCNYDSINKFTKYTNNLEIFIKKYGLEMMNIYGKEINMTNTYLSLYNKQIKYRIEYIENVINT